MALEDESLGSDEETVPEFVYIKTGFPNSTIRIPVASNYDLDNDYDYIMSRALKSYKQHREKEKADSRKPGLLKNNYLRKYLRPRTAPPARYVDAVKARNSRSSVDSDNVFKPKIPVDAITEVRKANPTDDETDRSARRVLQVAKVTVNMMKEQNASRKTQCFTKRNTSAHPWHSHSYPSVKPMEKFVRPPHAYMSASVGERDLAYSVSSGTSTRSSSAKSSPSHGCRPKSASSQKSKYEYDAGLFAHPKNLGNEYFVIHPDWVSESMSIQKLSLGDRTKCIPKSKSMTWPGRRCNSAPPPKYRNPITWEQIVTS